MKERYTANIRTKKNSFIKGKSNEDSSYNYYYSLSNNLKNKNYSSIVEILLCMKECALSSKNFIFKIISKLSFLMQSMVFKIPLLIIILILLGFCHIYFYEQLYFDNYYYAIKNEYLNKLTKEIDNKGFELDSLHFETDFDEIEELLFFNIYFKEQINMGLINENKINNTEIFSPLNNETGFIYSEVNHINNKLGINNDYNIYNNNLSTLNNSLYEFAKIYYYLLPSITLDQYKQNIYLNQSF